MVDNVIPIEVRGDIDTRAIEQLKRCAAPDVAIGAALSADGHVGYSQPIGGAIAYPDHISPSGVGYDIGCGNKAVRTDIKLEHLPGTDGFRTYGPFTDYNQSVCEWMDEIVRRISFGVGRKNDEPVDHPVFDQIRDADFAPQRAMLDKAVKQLGTVGAGNHYVDLFAGDDGYLWVGVHFGSRGFGHATASGFLAMAQGLRFTDRAKEGEMDAPPTLLAVDSELGQAYIAAMQLAGDYAYAGRDVVVDKVLEILGTQATKTVHNHHNYAWRETHDGVDVWVVRKGCTPAWPGQEGFVGATMGEDSVILEGVDSPGSASMLYSTVHGAGRLMSRTRAAGKQRKRWCCNNRDCDWRQTRGQHVEQPKDTRPSEWACPSCGHLGLTKRWVKEVDGEIDWEANVADLQSRGIELRGGAADEAPLAYKRLDEVLAFHDDTVRVTTRLTPIGVAMAGPDTADPYKD